MARDFAGSAANARDRDIYTAALLRPALVALAFHELSFLEDDRRDDATDAATIGHTIIHLLII
jgi:hypothetical protein